MKYLLGVDIGTQGTKASLCDVRGEVIGESFIESKLIYPEPGAVEQNPQDMFDSVLQAIRMIVSSASIKTKDIVAVSIDGQMAGIMGVGKDGLAVTPYDSWLDTRCGIYREQFLSFGEESIIELTGGPVTYAHGPKILWWKNTHPEIYKRIHKFVPPASFCTMQLCGLDGDEAFVDYTYLHFSGFSDNYNLCWSDSLLTALGVDRNKMPTIRSPYDVVGKVTKQVAEICGLVAGTSVVAGCGDTAASILGAGIIRNDLMLDVAGTASVLACATRDYAPDTKHKTLLYARSVLEDLFTPLAYINGGGMCLKWFKDDILSERYSYKELDSIAETVLPGSSNLFFVPHFSGRVCPNDTLVRGSFVNLSWQHDVSHLYRAILESIAYEYGVYTQIIKELIPNFQAEKIVSVGGGSRSSLFRQIKADVIGAPVATIGPTDTALLGTCAIAGYGVGLISSLSDFVEQFTEPESILYPNLRLQKYYQNRRDLYKQIIEDLHDFYLKVGKLESLVYDNGENMVQ